MKKDDSKFLKLILEAQEEFEGRRIAGLPLMREKEAAEFISRLKTRGLWPFEKHKKRGNTRN